MLESNPCELLQIGIFIDFKLQKHKSKQCESEYSENSSLKNVEFSEYSEDRKHFLGTCASHCFYTIQNW